MSLKDIDFADPKKGVVIRCDICNRKTSLSFEEFEKLDRYGKTDMFIKDKGGYYCIECFKRGRESKGAYPWWGVVPPEDGRGMWPDSVRGWEPRC